jgi:hypothetical protein
MLATEKAAKLPEAEDGGYEQDQENRDRGQRGQRNDHPFHRVSVPRGFSD